MFSRNKNDELEQAKVKAQQEIERDRSRLEQERKQLEQEREALEKARAELEAREEKLEDLEDELQDLEDELEDQEDELEDAKSVREILDVVSERMPTLVKGINEAMYTPETMENMAKSLATYYRTLVDAGMDREMADRLTTIQASSMNHLVTHNVRHSRPVIAPRPPTPPRAPTPPRPSTPPRPPAPPRRQDNGDRPAHTGE